MSFFGGKANNNTKLTPEEEARFLKWAAPRMGDLEDYDLRGAWKANAQAASNGHLPDTFKKPNHPTFSQESQYSTPDQMGGQWLNDGRGGWVFMASPLNMNNLGAMGLLDYFKQREPDAMPVLPINYDLRRGR